jgi:hypothetical protein
MRIAYWIPKGTNTSSEYVILIAFPLQQWLEERASMLRHSSIAQFVVQRKVGPITKERCKSFLPQTLLNSSLITHSTMKTAKSFVE